VLFSAIIGGTNLTPHHEKSAFWREPDYASYPSAGFTSDATRENQPGPYSLIGSQKAGPAPDQLVRGSGVVNRFEESLVRMLALNRNATARAGMAQYGCFGTVTTRHSSSGGKEATASFLARVVANSSVKV
jgi:hypothetical protein